MSSEVAVKMYGRWKRYPAYRDSRVEWIGEVPEVWDVRKFNHIADNISVGFVGSIEVHYTDETGVLLLKTGNIGLNKLLLNDVSYVTQEFHEANVKSQLSSGDIIIARHGDSGKSAVIPDNISEANCLNVVKLKKSNLMNGDFYAYLLNSNKYQQFLNASQGGSVQGVINTSDIIELKVVLPPSEEQHTIAAFLDRETGRIDTLIEKKERQVELLQEKRTTLISHAVTKGLDPDVKMKDSGVEWLGEFPEHWEMLALKRLASLKSGESITVESIDKDGDYPVFGGNGLRGYTTTFTHDGNYVLIGRQGALCGNINYAQGQFWASEHAVVVSPIGPVETKWLGELLRAMNLNQYSVSAAQPGLSVEMVSNLSIPQPPLQEQSTIATFLNRKTGHIDILTTKVYESISKLREYRTALISAAVTGKIDVRNKET